jgi:hypothetical protein
MANKEAKVWFVEAQKWTQHLPQEEVLACPHAKKKKNIPALCH